jgi:hypothetical protein
MNKIIEGVNYQFIDGYDNKRITAYSRLEVDRTVKHNSGKSWIVYLNQHNCTYYAGRESISLTSDLYEVYKHITTNSSLFSLSTFQRLEEFEGVLDERVILLTWRKYENVRKCVQIVSNEEIDFISNSKNLKGHIQYVVHSTKQHEKHKAFNHPKLGTVYYESRLVYNYQTDLDLRSDKSTILLPELIDTADRSLVGDLSKELDFALEELAL